MKEKDEAMANLYFSWTFWIALLLTTIMVFMFYNRLQAQRQSRQTAAQSEMKNIANGLRMAEVDTGYYVSLRALDDNPGTGNAFIGNLIDYKIGSEPVPFAINSDGSFNQSKNFPNSSWKGPYVSYQSICTTGNPNSPSEYGSPLDPWKNPYRFFTTKILTNPAPGDPTTSSFGRFTLVSYGPDGLPGNGGKTPAGQGDDITYSF